MKKKIEKIKVKKGERIYLEADLVNGLVNVTKLVEKINEIIDKLNKK